MFDLAKWIPNNKNFKANEKLLMGTTIQSMGDLKGYTVQMVFLGMAIPSRVVGTFEDAVAIETEIWAEVTK